MANLNLSQFTEKTFVADADWVFVWDTAGAISKKVSRNSLLNSGTLATSAPVTISQTWNDVAQTFKALVVNAAGTSDANSASGSLLLDLQLNGVSKASIRKNGIVYSSNLFTSPIGFNISNSTDGGNQSAYFAAGGIGLPSGATFGFTSVVSGFGSLDTILLRDGAANTLALRNGAAAQTFNVYGTYTSGTSYERLTLSAPSAANAIIGTNKGGSGGTARGLELQTDGVTRMTLAAGGGITIPFSGGSLTIASDINGQRDIYCGTGRYFRFNNTTATSSAGAGILLFEDISASNATPRFQIGGTSASFPALKRSTVRLQAVLANDSGFTNIQGKLTTDTDYTATTIVPTGFLTLYDAQGTAYRVPCVAA